MNYNKPWDEASKELKHSIEGIHPPAGIESWFKAIDAVIILDNIGVSRRLAKAAEEALGKELHVDYCQEENLLSKAAIGAALRAREWIGYWIEDQKWKRRWVEEEQRYLQE
jgi:hypothetical protein